MTSSQRGSEHRQFYQSDHRQRVAYIKGHPVVQTCYAARNDPDIGSYSYYNATLLPSYVITESISDNAVIGRIDPSEKSIALVSGTPPFIYGNRYGLNPSPDNLITFVGCYSSKTYIYWPDVNFDLSKMRISMPAWGRVGYYRRDGTYADAVLESSTYLERGFGAPREFYPSAPTEPTSTLNNCYTFVVFFPFHLETDAIPDPFNGITSWGPYTPP